MTTAGFCTRGASWLAKWIPYSHISHFGPDTLAQAIEATPGLETVRYLTYTPWELRLRMLRGGGKGSAADAPALTGLASATGGDSRDSFRAYPLRRWLNPLWLRLTARQQPGGDLMYWLARKAVS